ncbi:MAG: hypothetical protein WC602_05325 [archaeon]
MTLELSKHGDILEQHYYSIIEKNIPAYEEIWKRYIGNNGKAKIIQVVNLPCEENSRRILFSQYHYSAFESIVCICELINDVDEIELSNIKNYVRLNNCFLSFQAHAGRIRDCVKKMGESFNLNYLYIELDEYYKQRNEILHGCKIPFLIIDGFYAIPKIKGIKEDVEKWHDSMGWNDIQDKDGNFKFINDHMAETYREILKLLNKCLYTLLPYIKDVVKRFNFNLEPNEDIEYISDITISGMYGNHFYTYLSLNSSGSTN